MTSAFLRSSHHDYTDDGGHMRGDYLRSLQGNCNSQTLTVTPLLSVLLKKGYQNMSQGAIIIGIILHTTYIIQIGNPFTCALIL